MTGASGTDFSQQDAAQFSGTDLVVDIITNTKVTSVSHSFTANDVGNGIQISAGVGFTAGFYQIISVSSSAATLDRSPAAIGVTGGTWALGGALASPGKAAGATVPANTAWVKNGTYIMTSASTNISGGCLSLPNSGFSSNAVLAFRGYTTTRGDGAPTKPIFDAGILTNATLITVAQPIVMIEGLELKGNSNTSVKGLNGGGTARNCKFTGFTNSGITNTNVIADCVVSGCSTQPAIIPGSLVLDCSVQSNTAGGIQIGASGVLIDHCLVAGNTGAGIAGSGGGWAYRVLNSTIANNTGDGIRQLSDTITSLIRNCVLYGNGGYGINPIAASDPVFIDNCGFGSNTSGAYSGSPRVYNQINLTANPFTNLGAGDFSLNNTVGGGRSLRGAGIPGVMPGGLSTGYLDIGTLQHQDLGGGVIVENSGGLGKL